MEKAFNIITLIGEASAYDKKQALELKKPKSWCKSVSAFANGNGGKLIFGRLRLMERRGSGFKKICDNYRIQPHFRDELTPEFYSNQGEFTLTLWNMNYGAQNGAQNGASSLIANQNHPKPTKGLQSEMSSETLQEQILEAIKLNPSATVLQLMSTTGLAERTIKKYIKILKETNAITRVGNNRKGHWQVN